MERIPFRYNISPNASQENLKVLSHCPVCQKAYNPMTANIVEEREGAHLVHITCNYCQSSIVAVVVSGGFGVSSVGFVTDLSSEDVARLKSSTRVSSDDILDLYKALESGNWQDVLQE